MATMACINIPDLALQILLRRHPEWRSLPVAIADKDSSFGKILILNEKARKSGIYPGMRFTGALSICPNLRACSKSEIDLASTTSKIALFLRQFSPLIETSTDEPGLFWLTAAGLEHIFPSLTNWAKRITRTLTRNGLRVTMIVGYNHFAICVLAKSQKGIFILDHPDSESEMTQKVRIEFLSLEPKVLSILRKLGVRTVRDFLALPSEGVLSRFGKAAYSIHRLASKQILHPLNPDTIRETLCSNRDFDYPVDSIMHVMPVFDEMIEEVIGLAEKGYQNLVELIITLGLDNHEVFKLSITPSRPTLKLKAFNELLFLKAQNIELPCGIIEIRVDAHSLPFTFQQLELFSENPARDLQGASQALTMIRSEFSDGLVVKAKLKDGHLPEGQFCWSPISRIKFPNPKQVDDAPVIRRIHRQPQLMSAGCESESEQIAMPAIHNDRIDRMIGPYKQSGNWWSNKSYDRDYYYGVTARGRILWIYYNHYKKEWMLQGDVA